MCNKKIVLDLYMRYTVNLSMYQSRKFIDSIPDNSILLRSRVSSVLINFYYSNNCIYRYKPEFEVGLKFTL